MNRRGLSAARSTVRAYRRASVGAAAYAVGRLVVAPLGPIASELARPGTSVLSLGCGFGVVERYLVELEPSLRVHGIDLDPEKLAATARTGADGRLVVRHGDATRLEVEGGWDAVLICDLLHHIDPRQHRRTLQSAAEALAPGGVCLVKDLDVAPTWKRRWNAVHDRLVAGPEPITCRPPEEIAADLRSVGLEVDLVARIDRRWEPYAHSVVRGRRPT